MNLCRLRQELAHFVHGKGDIWTSECQILKCSNYTAIPERVVGTQQCTTVTRKALGCSKWSGSGLAVLHVDAMKEIKCILLLRQCHDPLMKGCFQSKKVLQSAQVFDGKTRRQRPNKAIHHSRYRTSNHNIINIHQHVYLNNTM